MVRLTELSMRNRAVVALVSLAILIGGVFAVRTLGQEMIPPVEMPMGLVVATNEGVSAALMEQQLADPIEGAIEAVPGVESVQTTAVNSALYATVEFRYGTNIDAANEKLSTSMTRVARLLPDEVETTVMTGSMEDLPVVNLAVRGPDRATLYRMVNNVLEPRLSRLENVRTVTVTGVTPDEVVITPRAGDLAALGLTMDRVNTLLADNGVALGAGQIDQGDLTMTVQSGQPIASVEELRQLRLGRDAAGAAITLEDVADVIVQAEEPTSYSRLNGETAVSLLVTKTPEGNTVEVSHAVHEVLDALTGAMAADGIEAGIVFDQAPFIENSITGLVEEGALGLAFAILVIWMFLVSVRATLVSAVSIPLSLLMAFIGLNWTGQTLNILTLAAITMAIGRVVDDSIVVIENIKRHLSYGEEKKKAIVTAVGEVAGAVASSTFCTAAVFLPLTYIGGMVGELFRPFGPTVAIALLASLGVALTIVPVLAYWFVQAPASIDDEDRAYQREQSEQHDRSRPWQRLYLPTLRAVLRHRAITLAAAAAVLAATALLVPRLETNFLGDIGGSTVTVEQTFLAGTSLEVEDEQARRTEEAINQIEGVDSVMARASSAGLRAIGFSAEPVAVYYVSVAQGAERATLVDEIRRAVADSSGDCVGQTSVSSSESSMLMSTSVDLIVRATDVESLHEAASQVEDAAKALPGAIDVVNNLADEQPMVQVTMDRDKVLDHGLTETTAAALLRGLMVPTQIGALENDEDGEVPVFVSLGDPAANLDDLKALPLISTPAGDVTVADLATVEVDDQPVSLSRMNGERSATISVTPASDDLGLVIGGLAGAVDGLELPAGASVEIAGVAAEMDEAFTDLAGALLIAVLTVFILMVGTFGSLVQPFILLISIPFAATGALLALVVTSTPLGVPAFIGLLLLVGIVVANAVVLIDLINQYRRDGMALEDAIVEGARKRLRPILMTAAATVFALIPMALGLTGGGGSFISKPLALVVIGGLVTSTFLTLVVVPVLYQVEARAHDRREARSQARHERRRQDRIKARRVRLSAAESTPDDRIDAALADPGRDHDEWEGAADDWEDLEDLEDLGDSEDLEEDDDVPTDADGADDWGGLREGDAADDWGAIEEDDDVPTDADGAGEDWEDLREGDDSDDGGDLEEDDDVPTDTEDAAARGRLGGGGQAAARDDSRLGDAADAWDKPAPG
ncbi:MAG: efflux RND transporter permease subunit, partial [Bifidobacteriaceae bacterium]|nr:efflux RND transporter permease subunit [Bifidobacteriaceae bacterium]